MYSGMLQCATCLLVIFLCSVHCQRRDCRFGPRCVFPCRCLDAEQCHPTTGECPSGCDAGMDLAWKGESCQEGNIALGMETRSSGDSSTADLAVDGYMATNESDRNCAKIVNNDHSSAAWEVEFGHPSLVRTIVIHSTFIESEAETLTNLSFRVRDSAGVEHVCLDYTGRAPVGYRATLSINCIPPRIGRQVVLRRMGKSSRRLTLCEVQVVGHKYISCSSCPGSCDSITGCVDCPAGTRWPDCTRPCPEGLYGANCQNFCENCRPGTTCNPTDGACGHGCADGWFGYRCHLQHGSVGPTKPATTIQGYTGVTNKFTTPRVQATGPQAGPHKNTTNPLIGEGPHHPYDETYDGDNTDVNSADNLHLRWWGLLELFITILYQYTI